MYSVKDRLIAVKYRPSGFDYMRFVLATAVILFHSFEVTAGMDATIRLWGSYARPLIAIVVPMFFALSGFLVACSLERNKSMISFLGLRVVRLMPALAVEIMLSALILGPIFTDVSLHQYYSDPRFWHYFGNVVGDIHYVLPGVFETNPYPRVINSQFWTIPFELKCYAVLTVFAGIGLFSSRRLLLAVMIALQVGIAVTLLFHHIHYDPVFRGRLLVGCFLAGLTMYRWRDRLPWRRDLAAASCIVAALLLWLPPYGDFFISVPATYLTVYLGLLNPRRNKSLLGGNYSYGMYLYGYPIQQAFTALGVWTYSWWLNMLVTWPAAFLFAAFSWWCVEKPALRLKTPLLRLEAFALRFRPFYLYSRFGFLSHSYADAMRTASERA